MNKQIVQRKHSEPYQIFNIISYAHQKQIITSTRKQELLYEYKLLLNELVLAYTHGNSTSISEKKYIQNMKACDYILHHCNLSPISNHLRHNSLHQLYDLGIQQLHLDLSYIENLVNTLQTSCYSFQNERYLDVVFHQIPNYMMQLKGVDAFFHFYHTTEDFDYPLIDGIPLFHKMYHKQGSDFMIEYLERLTIEQKFCSSFQDEIPALLDQYEQIKGFRPFEIHINLFEIILYQWISNMILYQTPKLSLSKQDCIRLKKLLKNEQISKQIKDFLSKKFSTDHFEVCEYIQKNLDIIYMEWNKFITSSYDFLIYKIEDIDYIELKLQRSETDQFAMYMIKLASLYTMEEKLSYIKSQQMDIYDMFDLLDHDVFYEEEYTSYFQTFTSMDIATFLKLLLLDTTHQPSSISTLLSLFEPQNTWQTFFHQYINNLTIEMKQEILYIIKRLKFI